uniref:Uncharacterized protein n=1 Tax=Amphimedon queenslandica TaxID=400682 RepID=A0A1X7VHL1_AMPQE
MQIKIVNSFKELSLSEHFVRFATISTKTEDYSVVYNAVENFRSQLEALELPMVGKL